MKPDHVAQNLSKPSRPTDELPDLGRQLTHAERELIRLLAEMAAEQFLAQRELPQLKVTP